MPLNKALLRTLCVTFFTLLPFSCFAATLFTDVTLIDGTGTPAKRHQNVLVSEGWVVAIRDFGRPMPEGVTVISAAGKTMIPLMVNVHGHVGFLNGNRMGTRFFSRGNVQRHLLQYRAYGIGAVLSMGTDDLEQVYNLRDQSRSGELPGAQFYTAGQGFGVEDGAPFADAGFSEIYRPRTADEARAQVKALATGEQKPDIIKIWVDDANSTVPKMTPAVYEAIIDEAHHNGLRVAAHVYYQEDARRLVEAGVDVIAHSIRDALVDEDLLNSMRALRVTYVPTLSLDEFAYVYQGRPEWMDQPFFRVSLEDGVFEQIDNSSYRYKVRTNPKTSLDAAGFQIALENLKRVYDAGVNIALGTDSGAQPTRPIGFSAHHELGLMVAAGIPPVQAIRIATRNGADVLRIPDTGTLEVGKRADFILLDGDLEENIANSQRIHSVWQGGNKVSTGPLTDPVLKASRK